MTGTLAILCVILISISCKLAFRDDLVSGRNRNTERNLTSRTPIPRRTPSLSPGVNQNAMSGVQPSPSRVPNTRNTPAQQINVKRTFKGDGTDIWSEYIRYFENISELNGWDNDRKRKVFFTVLRG